MATHTSIRPIASLLAVAILTSIWAIIPGNAHSSELAERQAIEGTNRTSVAGNRDGAPSADTVKEARWAKPQRDYVLGESGRIVPAQPQISESEVEASAFVGSGEGEPYGQNYSGVLFSPRGSHGEAECGPSPATPDEITRLVVEAAERHEVDADFALAIATAESRLDRLRNSPKGARGPMQLMPETADRFGVADICDPEQNVDGGVRYLRELIEEFRNPMLVAAAYNAGEGRVREHGGIPPFKETVGYVAEVLNVQMRLEGSGLAAPRKGEPVDGSGPASSVRGVVTSRERRQWVGGVMHF